MDAPPDIDRRWVNRPIALLALEAPRVTARRTVVANIARAGVNV